MRYALWATLSSILFAVQAESAPNPQEPVSRFPALAGSSTLCRSTDDSDARTAVRSICGELQPNAHIFTVLYGIMCFGDTNKNGLPEAWMGVNENFEFTCRAIEYRGGAYEQVAALPDLLPGSVGDFDGDGRAEIIGQFGSVLRVYEAASFFSYPSQLVWESSPMSNVIGWPTTADSDRDGRVEIIHSRNGGGGRLVIFENDGDNSFALKLSAFVGAEYGPKVVADLDGDGMIEIALCGTSGILRIFESPANDVWVQSATDSTGLINALAISGGFDTDGNKVPEIFVSGNPEGFDHTAKLYEARGNDQFGEVAKFYGNDGVQGFAANTVARTCDGNREYVWMLLGKLHIYRPIGIGEWEREVFPDPNPHHQSIAAFDINGNGWDEVFYTRGGNTQFLSSLVLERPGKTTDLVDTEWSFKKLLVHPTPSRGQVHLSLATRLSPGPGMLSVFDASGRLVRREPWSSQTGVRVWDTATMRPGLYFLRLDSGDGSVSATGRAVVIR